MSQTVEDSDLLLWASDRK